MGSTNEISGRINCCRNPFNLINHLKRKSLSRPSAKMLQKMPVLNEDNLLCTSCGKKILLLDDPLIGKLALIFLIVYLGRIRAIAIPCDFKYRPYLLILSFMSCSVDNNQADSLSTAITSTTSASTSFCSLSRLNTDLSLSTLLPVINQGLVLMGNSPIPKRRCPENPGSSAWITHKIDRVSHNLKELFGIKFNDIEAAAHDRALMLAQMKQAFHASGTVYERKIEILTLLPNTWSIPRMMQTIGSTYHMAKLAKDLARQGGILSKPIKRKGKYNTSWSWAP